MAKDITSWIGYDNPVYREIFCAVLSGLFARGNASDSDYFTTADAITQRYFRTYRYSS